VHHWGLSSCTVEKPLRVRAYLYRSHLLTCCFVCSNAPDADEHRYDPIRTSSCVLSMVTTIQPLQQSTTDTTCFIRALQLYNRYDLLDTRSVTLQQIRLAVCINSTTHTTHTTNTSYEVYNAILEIYNGILWESLSILITLCGVLLIGLVVGLLWFEWWVGWSQTVYFVPNCPIQSHFDAHDRLHYVYWSPWYLYLPKCQPLNKKTRFLRKISYNAVRLRVLDSTQTILWNIWNLSQIWAKNDHFHNHPHVPRFFPLYQFPSVHPWPTYTRCSSPDRSMIVQYATIYLRKKKKILPQKFKLTINAPQ